MSLSPVTLVGFGMIVIGLLTGLAGILTVTGSAPRSQRRRRGIIIAIAGLVVVWIGGFVGAFSSL
ncbi:hypothetical protein AADG42_09645 [Ammonicoccus fulvus]|uniref:Uncharacterized protein n=1 Tax=Ammonicoccus fulvus TaxID=3138240 RepID=A0ABZ3FRV0_9ACTN